LDIRLIICNLCELTINQNIMRKLIFPVVLFSILLIGCTDSKKKEEAARIEKEIVVADSIAKEVEKAKQDIEQSIQSVDSLLNEL